MKTLLAMVVTSAAVWTVGAGDFTFKGCRAEWTADTLTVGNGAFSRTYAGKGGALRTISFTAGNTAWQREDPTGGKRESLEVTAAAAKWSPVGVDGIRVIVKTGGKTTELNLYPGMPGVISKAEKAEAFGSLHDLDIFASLENAETRKRRSAVISRAKTCGDLIRFTPRHIKTQAITLLDQTDIRDRLVDVEERLLMDYVSAFTLTASALDCRDVLTDNGLLFVRLAPMPICRPNGIDDFLLDGSPREVALIPNGYPLVELAYTGGQAGRERAAQAFQRAIRPYRPGRDGILLSNTWGAGNRDSRINQAFLLKEIEAGAKIGVDVIQIDDGWQAGRTANSMKKANEGKKKVWSGYWDTDPDFWKEDRERFPDGLDLLVKKAAEKGMRFGLWFGPDSSNEAKNWEKDADCLLDYHNRLGIDYFKMDSIKLATAEGFARNRMMFDKMLRESKGAMTFDLDCTAQVRPGYLGLPDIGPLFLENRYTKRPVYWPHHTLKNLWDLSHVIDPVRLRVEFNNPDTNHANYEGSPLGHGNYRPDALFATVMAGSPLAWMELSDVSEGSVAALAPVVATWKKERARWHGGTIHPVGSRPDGMAWTGFVSEAADGTGGYALLFRELNAESTYALDLKPIFGAREFTKPQVIAGRGRAAFEGATLKVDVDEKLGYVWVKW